VLFQRYDANGSVVGIRDLLHRARRPQSATLYAEYDDAARLVRAVQCGAGGYVGAFSNDPYGNLAAKDGAPYQYGAPAQPHQVTSVGGASLAYDTNGNMVALPGDRRLTYDAEGRLVEIRRAGVVVAEYLYDHQGERVAARTSAGTTFFFGAFDVRDGIVVRHLRLGDRLVASSPVSAGTSVASVEAGRAVVAQAVGGSMVLVLLGAALAVPGRRRLGPFGRVRRSAVLLLAMGFLAADVVVPAPTRAQCDPDPGVLPPGTFFYHVDQLGSPRLLTDRLGQVLEELVDRPYGTLGGVFDSTGASLAASRSAFQFTGHRGDDGTGLMYFRARYYDPALGLFVSHDPARQFMSPYSYGGGDPLNGRDPTGAFWIELLVAVIVGAVLGAVVAGAQAAISGATVSEGLKAVGRGALMGAVSGGALGIVGQAVGASTNVTLQVVYEVALAGSATYQAVESFRAGNIVAGLSAIASAAMSLRNASGALRGPGKESATDSPEVGGPSDASTGARQNVNTPLPDRGPGYRFAGKTTQRFGRESTIAFIEEVGDQWSHLYPDGPEIRITAISANGGGRIPKSTSHQTGVDIDVGVVRADGEPGGTTISQPSYSRPLTQHLVTRMHATGMVDVILFNDPIIRGVSLYAGHDNHLHVRLK
jgi:RHS repeat-associated protein